MFEQSNPVLLEFLWSQALVPILPIVFDMWSVFVGLTPIIFVALMLQLAFPAVKRRPKILSLEMWNDFIYAVQSSFIYGTSLGLVVTLSVNWVSSLPVTIFPGLNEAPYLLQVFLALWLYDFSVYCRHRIEHEVSVIWPIHAIHHTSQQVDVLTVSRLHFLEVMIGSFIATSVGALSGLQESALIQGFSIYVFWNFFIHTNIKFKFPGPLKYIFVSPFMHRWHHAKEVKNINYSVVFAFHDWLLRSAYYPDHEPQSYGFVAREHEDVHESYVEHQLYPFRVWMLRLFKWVGWKKDSGKQGSAS